VLLNYNQKTDSEFDIRRINSFEAVTCRLPSLSISLLEVLVGTLSTPEPAAGLDHGESSTQCPRYYHHVCTKTSIA
jgi:hypothetical protein